MVGNAAPLALATGLLVVVSLFTYRASRVEVPVGTCRHETLILST